MLSIGDATPSGFEPWMGDPGAVIRQLEVAWPLDHDVEAGEVCWLDAIERGLARAEEVERRRFS